MRWPKPLSSGYSVSVLFSIWVCFLLRVRRPSRFVPGYLKWLLLARLQLHAVHGGNNLPCRRRSHQQRPTPTHHHLLYGKRGLSRRPQTWNNPCNRRPTNRHRRMISYFQNGNNHISWRCSRQNEGIKYHAIILNTLAAYKLSHWLYF